MSQSLESVRRQCSPRLNPPPTPARSVIIHGVVLGLWVILFAMAFGFRGIGAWSTGVAYIIYDTLLLAFVFWKTFGLARNRLENAINAADAAAQAVPTTIGVIVAAHNEATVLPVTLAALLTQSDPPEEIIIADDGSTDRTSEVLQNLYGLATPALGELSAPATLQPSLRWLRVAHAGKAAALNSALVRLTTETVLTVDGDTLLESFAIAAVRRAFSEHGSLVAATGVLTPICRPTLGGRLFQWFQTYEYIRNFLSRYAWMRVQSLLLISGAFASFRRSAVLEVGGFDPDCLVEDYELIHRMYRHSALHGLGWSTEVLGGALARTEAPGTMAAFLRQRRRWFGGFLQTQYWYRDMVGNRRYGALGTLMLPVKAVDTLQPLYGLTAFFLLVYYLLTGRIGVLIPVTAVIIAKIILDLAFHVWSVHLYRRWTRGPGESSVANASFGYALLAALAEPFSFQILRHCGAAWGWVYFLTGRKKWGKQTRGALLAHDEDRE